MQVKEEGTLEKFVDNALFSYRYKLLWYMLVTGFFISLLSSAIRYSQDNMIATQIDLALVASFAGGLYLLRKNRHYIHLVGTMQLVLTFALFTAVTVFLEDDHIKLLWYTLSIMVTFMLKGTRAGFMMYAATLAIIPLLHILPMVNLHLSDREVIMAELFYTIATLYSYISVREHEKSIKHLLKASTFIQEQKQALYKQLRTDHISKLPNALALRERVLNKTDNAVVISMHIDDFTELSNIFGEEKMIEIVRKSAQMLAPFIQSNTMLYHIELAQFVFFIDQGSVDSARRLAKSIQTFFEKNHIRIDSLEISLSFSIGIAQGENEKVLVHANTVLQEALLAGSNHMMVYKHNAQREEEQKNNLYWNSKIHEVISQGNLRVYYQPIIDNITQKVVKYECLIRALDDDKIVPPFFFLQATKSRGLLPEITKVVIEESFKLFAHNEIGFSINITDDDLKENYLVNFLLQKSKQYGINPQRVYLEVLENITASKAEDTSIQFEALKKLGFQISIDDFGAEASNLSRLLTLEADIIKIDGQFIKNLDSDANSLKIVETVVSLASKMGAKTVAEFVHNEEIFKIVQKLGVDYSQGYYFSPPLPQIAEETVEETA